ncbi:MAG: GTP-binding protein [Candidatus Helarchaeota archaeon]
MLIDFGTNTIQSKIVFYGSAMSGKTTALKYLFDKFQEKVISITTSHTTTPRTLFYDFGAIDLKFGIWNFKLNMWTATGQDFYCATRSTVLQGVDGIIFMADSRKKLLEENKRSWEELVSYFRNNLLRVIPIIICLNKQDLQNLVTIEEFKQYLNLNHNIEILRTVALTGENIHEAFKKIFRLIFTVHSNIKDTINNQLH